MFEETSPEEVERLMNENSGVSIIDVREPDEFAGGHIKGAVNIPVNEVQSRMGEIDRTKEHIIVCLSGKRSGFAASILSASGYRVRNMNGGMMNWTGEVYA
ncbi:MAG: rhodanese-like domain-containing protein [Sporolactobacillus sp.]